MLNRSGYYLYKLGFHFKTLGLDGCHIAVEGRLDRLRLFAQVMHLSTAKIDRTGPRPEKARQPTSVMAIKAAVLIQVRDELSRWNR